MRNPVIVALDLDEPAEAIKLFNKLSSLVGGFKIGPRLTLRADKSFLRDIKQAGVLFFDHKFFDIPSTALASVEAAAELGADWVTVHALNGLGCLKKLFELEKKIRNVNPKFKVVVVTVLTSFEASDFPPIWKSISIEESVLSLAQLAVSAGLKTFVCSPMEARALKERVQDSFLITPGVKFGAGGEDQKRFSTPKIALENGASALVIGRAILKSPQPVALVQDILGSL